MYSSTLPVDSGLDVMDVSECKEFWGRALRHRDLSEESQAVLRLCETFLENPDSVLQELVQIALKLCGADSAGVTLAQPSQGDEAFWLWAAVAGEYRSFVGSALPRTPSACGRCLERGVPQHLRVRDLFWQRLGIDAKPVTDGILQPWSADEREGTVWVLAHGRPVAFDPSDLGILKTLADFAELAWQHGHGEEDSGGDAVAISRKLGQMVWAQRRLIAELLQINAAKRADAEQRFFEEEQVHLKEMGQRLEEWEGNGEVQ